MLSACIGGAVAEGHVAEALGALQAQFPDVSMGSYPYFRRPPQGTDGQGQSPSYGVNFVLRSTDQERLAAAAGAVRSMIRAHGATPEDKD